MTGRATVPKVVPEAVRVARARVVGRAAMLIVALAGVLAAPAVEATVYKCRGEQGSVIYQELPCLNGRELRNFDTDPPDLSIIQGGLTKLPPAASISPAPAATASPRESRPGVADPALGKGGGDAVARKFIRQGMSEAEVMTRIGKPDATSGGGRSATSRWSYLPAPEDPDTVTTITFLGGVVSDVSRKVVRK